MATKFQTYQHMGPFKGAYMDVHSRDVPPEGFALMDEFHIQDARIMKYLGWQEWTAASYTPPATAFNYGYDFEKASGTRYFVIGDEDYLYANPHTGTFTNLNPAAPFNGAATDRWQGVEFNDKLYLSNRVDGLQVFNGTTLATLASTADGGQPTSAWTMENVLSHIVLGNTVEGGTRFRQRVRWCKIDNPDIWIPSATQADSLTANNEAGYYDFPQDLGEILVIKNLGPNAALIYGTRGIFRMSYIGLPLVWSFERVVDGEGIFAPYSMAVANDVHFFLGNRDFYMFSGSGELRGIGADRVISSFLGRYDKTERENIYSFVHHHFTEIWWVYVNKLRNLSTFNSALCYNWHTDTWSTRGETTPFNFSFLASYLTAEQKTIEDATNAIRDAVGTWRDKQSKGSWVIIGGN